MSNFASDGINGKTKSLTNGCIVYAKSDISTEDLVFIPDSLAPVKPRIDILEETHSYSKTLEIRPQEKTCLSCQTECISPNGSVSGVFYSPPDSAVDPNLTAHLDNVAAHLGFQVENPTYTSDNSDNYKTSYTEQMATSETEMLNIEPTVESTIPKKPARKPSFFSKLVRRLSTTRLNRRVPVSNNVQNKSSDEGHSNCPKDTSAPVPAGNRIRRWFSRRLNWLPQPMNRGESTRRPLESHNSLASAGAVLESSPLGTSDATSMVDFSRKAQVEFGSVPVARRRFPNLVDGSQATLGSPSDSGSRMMSETNDRDLSIDHLNDAADLQPLPLGHLNSTSLMSPSSKPLDIVFTEDDCRTPACDSLSHTKYATLATYLPQSFTFSTHPVSLSPTMTTSSTSKPVTPSYLSVSVAAFGYTGYGRKWMSAQALEASNNTSISMDSLGERSARPTKDISTTQPPVSDYIDRGAASAKHPIILTRQLTDPVPTVSDNATSRPAFMNLPPACSKAPHHRLERTENVDGGVEEAISPLQPSSDVTIKLRRSRTRSQNGPSIDEQENWQRSSLIMLTVSHASPRGASGDGAVTSVIPGSSSKRPLTAINLDFSEAAEIEEAQTYDAPACNGLGKVPIESADPNQPLPKGSTTVIAKTVPGAQELDGHYFLGQVNAVDADLRANIVVLDEYLKSNQMPDEVAGLLRTTIGKVNLLLSKKFVQFRGLCEENLTWQASLKAAAATTVTADGEQQFVTLGSDLDGFWAMVLLQVADVKALMKEAELIRANGWQPLPDDSSNAEIAKRAKKTPASARKCPTKRSTPATEPKLKGRNDTAARNLARQRLAAAKREMLARHQAQTCVEPVLDGTSEPSKLLII